LTTFARGRGVWPAYFVAATLLFAAGVSVSQHYGLEVGIRNTAAEEPLYMPLYRYEAGRQLLMVYVGSSACGWSNLPELPTAVESIKMSLAETARDRELSFKVVGLALDWIPNQGVEHLSRFGLFDEISTGGSWGGTFALNYLWSENVPRATPMVVVFSRIYITPDSLHDSFDFGEAARQLLVAKIGPSAISEWAAAGAPLPAEAVSQMGKSYIGDGNPQ
jgi:hypothetical protein